MENDSYFWKMTLKAYDMSKEEYIKNIHMNYVRNRVLSEGLKEKFFETLDPNEVTSENIEKNTQKFNEYVDSLIKKADVQYK